MRPQKIVKNTDKRKLRLAELTSKIVGKPYELGKWDCLSVIVFLCREWGVIPNNYKYKWFDLNTYEKVYPYLYKNNKEVAMKIFKEFIATLGEEIDTKRSRVGDFLIVRVKRQKKEGICIHAGNRLCLSAIAGETVKVMNLNCFDIVKAYRWRR